MDLMKIRPNFCISKIAGFFFPGGHGNPSVGSHQAIRLLDPVVPDEGEVVPEFPCVISHSTQRTIISRDLLYFMSPPEPNEEGEEREWLKPLDDIQKATYYFSSSAGRRRGEVFINPKTFKPHFLITPQLDVWGTARLRFAIGRHLFIGQDVLIVQDIFPKRERSVPSDVKVVVGADLINTNLHLFFELTPLSIVIPPDLYGDRLPLIASNDREVQIYIHGFAQGTSKGQRRNAGFGVFVARGSVYNSLFSIKCFQPDRVLDDSAPVNPAELSAHCPSPTTAQRAEILGLVAGVTVAQTIIGHSGCRYDSVRLHTDSKWVMENLCPWDEGIAECREDNWTTPDESIKHWDLLSHLHLLANQFSRALRRVRRPGEEDTPRIWLQWISKADNKAAVTLARAASELDQLQASMDVWREPMERAPALKSIYQTSYVQFHKDHIYAMNKEAVREAFDLADMAAPPENEVTDIGAQFEVEDSGDEDVQMLDAVDLKGKGRAVASPPSDGESEYRAEIDESRKTYSLRRGKTGRGSDNGKGRGSGAKDLPEVIVIDEGEEEEGEQVVVAPKVPGSAKSGRSKKRGRRGKRVDPSYPPFALDG